MLWMLGLGVVGQERFLTSEVKLYVYRLKKLDKRRFHTNILIPGCLE